MTTGDFYPSVTGDRDWVDELASGPEAWFIKQQVGLEAEAAESRGRAVGWREAIEALRDVQRYLDWDSESRFLGHPLLTDGQMLAAVAYLESLAPKETP